MLKSREALCKEIDKYCQDIAVYNSICEEISDYAYGKHKVSKGIIYDILCGRLDLISLTDFVLFAITEAMDKFCKTKLLEKYYTEKEIGQYSEAIYEESAIEFPLEFKMIKIEDDQWIGKTDVTNLMELRKARLINYNTHAQRTMTKIVRKKKETYRITVNKYAVKSMMKSLTKKNFIPNTITLNIPLETNNDFYYDEETCTLIINSLEHFDITDGYHRYLALCMKHDVTLDFNYNMELRIVNWDESKARQFIFQEDQKTQMSKIESNTMDQGRDSNVVAERLNAKMNFALKGCIGNNGALIPLTHLSEAIDYFYFKNINKNKIDNKYIYNVTNTICDRFNYIIENNNGFIDKKYNFRDIAVIFIIMQEPEGTFYEKALRAEEYIEMINKNTYHNIESQRIYKPLVDYVQDVLRRDG